MLYELLLPSLPMLFASVIIAIVIKLGNVSQPLHIQELLSLSAIIYGVLTLLKGYAPKVYDYALQGIGMGIGFNMTGTAVLPGSTRSTGSTGVQR